MKVLIVKLDAIGDVLRTTSILPALHRKYQGLHVTWITRAGAMELVEGNRLIDRVLPVEGNYLEFLLNETFDLVICLDADTLSASIMSLARSDQKLGFATNARGAVVPCSEEATGWWLAGIDDEQKRANQRTYQEVMYEICRLHGPVARPMIPDGLVTAETLESLSAKLGLSPGTRTVGINTGGGSRWQNKRWVSAGYAELIRLLRRHHPDVRLLLYGGPEERETNKKLLAEVGGDVTDTGCENTLTEFIRLVALSDVFLTSDSLAFHIATALSKRVVVLVGPTAPWELDVYGQGEVLYADMECISCYKSRCSRTPSCMERLEPQTVLAALERQLHAVET